MELEVVYSGSFKCFKVFSIKMKEGSPKRCEKIIRYLKNKNSPCDKSYRKDFEKQEK